MMHHTYRDSHKKRCYWKTQKGYADGEGRQCRLMFAYPVVHISC